MHRRKAIRLDVTGFKPYFYVPADQAAGTAPPQQVTLVDEKEYRSIRSEPLRRITSSSRAMCGRCANGTATLKPISRLPPVHDRLRADRGVSAPATTADYHDLSPAQVDAPARSCIIDIECEDERGFPDPQRDAIIAITCYDSFDNDYTTFLFMSGGMPEEITGKEAEGGLANGCFRKDTHTICSYTDEVSMLRAFSAYIVARDPDVLSGWNFVDFDMPYIAGRMERLGLSATHLARLPGQTERNALRGRALLIS